MKPSVIDISHWQTVDPGFEPAKREGIVGVIHKLTEGSSYVDDTVDARAFLAREAGLLFGVYHFVRPGNMKSQAEFFVNTADKLNLDENGALLYALDHEDPGVSLKQALDFLLAVEELTGKSPVLYSGHVLKEQLADGCEDPRIYNYRLWLAQYSSSPELPKGYDVYWLWQYTDQGQLPGIAPAVDLNQYFGDRVDDLIEEWAGGFEPEPDPGPVPVPGLMYTTTITIVSDSPIGVHVKHQERGEV
jgi:lysozyme